MIPRTLLFAAAALVAALAMQSSAQALTITECSAKYKDAKAAGTLNGASWNDFRKSRCDLAPAKRPTTAAGSDATIVAAQRSFPARCAGILMLCFVSPFGRKASQKIGLGKAVGNFYLRARAEEALSFLIDAGGRHVELRLRARDRRTLTLDRKAMLLKIAGGEIAADAGQDLSHRADASGRIKHRPIHPVV